MDLPIVDEKQQAKSSAYVREFMEKAFVRSGLWSLSGFKNAGNLTSHRSPQATSIGGLPCLENQARH
ncbi:hypothetical protein QQP08_017828 [Theobroma cacao]|uniref:Uncharacterized protein n=1 Tax=Theobroma cacao TaxID=3641 RepID=A0A061EXI7_THECC|nr:Uncharacterized protein TCM_021535 [Theobroma cacao]WRX25341.1 hypothetical protein QQP08_017828 [Theobroma cacao]